VLGGPVKALLKFFTNDVFLEKKKLISKEKQGEEKIRIPKYLASQ
jgi:hypothetical protein